LGPRLSFLGNQVRDEYRVDSGVFGLIRQPICAKLQKWIEIAEQYDGHFDALSCAPHACKRVAEGNASPQGAFGCALNHLTVGDWITEGDAKFNDVCTRCREFN